MSVLAPGMRDRTFRTVLGGFDPEGVRGALESAAIEFDRLGAEIAHLRQQQADAHREIDRIGELERSLLRSCVAAEEDARIRCGAARRYATRLIAAAEEQAAARLDAPARERDRMAREIEAMAARRRQAADELERIIASLERVEETDACEADPHENGGQEAESEIATRPSGDECALPQAVAAAPHLAPGAARAGAETSGADLFDVSTDTGADDPRAEGVPVAAINPRPDPAPGQPAGRFRLALASGTAAALLLVLQGSAGVPRPDGDRTLIAGASFAPAAIDAPDGPAHDPDATARAVPDAPARPAGQGLNMRIKPLRRCWVRVVVDDRTDARELQAGEDIVLDAKRSIVLRVGDAGALSVELNGRVLPPLGLDGQVVERRFSPAAAAE
jgi:cell division initiation protein